MQAKPIARSEDLLLERVGGETVVYDTHTKEAHCLSPLAAAVFEHCDGRNTIDGLAALVAGRVGEPVDADRVVDALAQLGERGLLVGAGVELSRRDLMKKGALAGGAVAAVPLISSVVIPTAAAAQTPTCANIVCCPCNPGSEEGQPCCTGVGTVNCRCVAAESGTSCKQCKPGAGGAANEPLCCGLFPSTQFPGFPPNSDQNCPCTFAFVGCDPAGGTTSC